jgi:hypothetical protein
MEPLKQKTPDSEKYTLACPDVDLEQIKRSFENIPRDPHFEAGYRCRTQSRYRLQDGAMRLLDRFPLFQPSAINPLENYGGIVRDYDDLPAWLAESPHFLRLVKTWLSFVPYDVQDFSAHQIRTEGGGKPVPEGRHRDGYDHVALFVVNRHNISRQSARTTVWDSLTDARLLDNVLLEEGDLLCLKDTDVLHFTSALEPSADANDSYRDVIILTTPDHSKIYDRYHR